MPNTPDDDTTPEFAMSNGLALGWSPDATPVRVVNDALNERRALLAFIEERGLSDDFKVWEFEKMRAAVIDAVTRLGEGDDQEAVEVLRSIHDRLTPAEAIKDNE